MSGNAVLKVSPKRICFIDDSKTSAFVTKKMLKQHGYSVDHFVDAESALEALMDEDYALIITDLMISSDGGVNGDDLIRLVRFSGHPTKSQIPIVVVTGTGDENTLQDLIAVGANTVLQKPLNDELLNQSIQALIQPPDAAESDAEHNTEQTSAQAEGSAPSQTREPESPGSSDDQIISAQNVSSQYFAELTPEPSHTGSVEEPVPADHDVTQKVELDSEFVSRSMHEYSSDISTDRVSPAAPRKPSDGMSGTQAVPTNQQDIPVLTSAVDKRKSNKSSARRVADKTSGGSIGNEIESLLSAKSTSRNQPDTESDQLKADLVAQLTSAQSSPPSSDFSESISSLLSEPEAKTFSRSEEDSPVPTPIPAPAKKEMAPEKVNKPKQTTKQKPFAKNNLSDEDNPLLALLDHMDEDTLDSSKKPNKNAPFSSYQFKDWVPKAILGIIVLVVLVPAISFWLMTQKVVEVKTYTVGKGAIHSLISVPGKIDSKRIIKVSARAGGQLTKLTVKEGDAIKKGQILAQLDDSEAKSNIKRAQARLMSIEEEVALTSKTQERLQRALDVGAVSRQMVEDAEANWKTASAKQSVIEEELKSAELKLDRLKIRGPFDGVITAVFAQEGQWVSQSENLFTLVDMNQRVVTISVDASDSTSLSVGQTVVLRSGAFSGAEWSESIVKIGSATKSENSANVIKVTASLSKDAPDLRVGQQVDAEIRTNSKTDAMLLPYDVIFNHNGQQTVAIIENSKIVFVPIETGIESFTRIEVISGLRDGQQVVVPSGIPLEPEMNAVAVGVQTF